MNRKMMSCTLAAFVCLAGGFVQAATTYTLSGVNIDAYTGTPPAAGLIVQTDVIPEVPTTLFTLNDGESQSFDLFEIWTDEEYLNLDDFASQPITVTLSFSSPLSSGVVGGTTQSLTFFGFFSAGEVTWNGPPTIVNAPGVTYSIQLANTAFNNGGWEFGEFQPGRCYAGTVEATITQLATVPEPASLVSGLLGATVLGGGWYLRRRRAAA